MNQTRAPMVTGLTAAAAAVAATASVCLQYRCQFVRSGKDSGGVAVAAAAVVDDSDER